MAVTAHSDRARALLRRSRRQLVRRSRGVCARALADLEALRADSTGLVLAANGGSLLHRVRRLLGTPSHAGRGPGWLAATAAIFLIAGIAIGSLGRSVLEADHGQDDESLEPRRRDRAHARPNNRARSRATCVLGAATSRRRAESHAADERGTRRPAAVDAFRIGVADRRSPVVRSAAHVLRDAIRNGVHGSARASTPEWLAPIPPLPPTPPTPPEPPSPPRATDAAEAAVSAGAATTAVAAGTTSAAGSTGAARRANRTPGSRDEHVVVVQRQRQAGGQASGEVTFTDDDSDVKSCRLEAPLGLKEGGWLSSRTVEFRADGEGNIQRRYWEGWSEKPFEPAGRAVAVAGLAAAHSADGHRCTGACRAHPESEGSVGRARRDQSDRGKLGQARLLQRAAENATLDAQTVAAGAGQAGREIESDFELASLLISASGRLLNDDASRAAFFEAAKSIDSDFEMRRVFSPCSSAVRSHRPPSR